MYTNTGTSMLPLIRQGRDALIIVPRPKVLKKYDIVLYKRGEKYILHRIIDVQKGIGGDSRKQASDTAAYGTTYTILGDNCEYKEFGIPDEYVIGILQAIVRNGKRTGTDSLQLRIYGRAVVFLYPVRRMVRKARHIAGAVIRRLKRG